MKMDSSWPEARLAAVTVKIGSGVTPKGGSSVYSTNGIPFIRSQNVVDDHLDLSDVAFIDQSTHADMASSRVLPLDVLLNITGASIGRSCVVPADFVDGNVNQHVCIIRPNECLDPFYLQSFLTSCFGQKQIALCQAGGNRQGLNYDQIGRFKIPLPPLTVQQAITRVLSTWDGGIRQLSDLIAAKLRFKQGLMQQLLTGKRRFPKCKDSSFVEYHVGDVLKETFRPVAWNDDELYQLASIRRHSGGLFWREALLGKQIKVKKLHSLEEGDFLISHIQAAYGAMGLVPAEFADGKVSDMYTILTPKSEGTIDMRYIDYLSQMKRMRHQAYLACNGFFAERLRLNFDPAEFMKQRIVLPECIEEQSRIADLLDTLVGEIELLRKQLEALKQQKKGLMQKLLTGQVRVPASGGPESASGGRESPVSERGGTS
jgi:type I restriction enzyme S subunit